MNNVFDLVDVKITDPLREKGIIYVGQYGTSGYAVAAKGYICDFIMRGFPISWKPIKFDDSEMTDENFYNIVAKSAINKKLSSFGTLILHCTADLWPKYRAENEKELAGKKVIGYTVWETSALPESWVGHINTTVDEVWCPSFYNKEVFENSGVKVPVRRVPHVFLRSELPDRCTVSLPACSGNTIYENENVYTFYNISELNERKNVMGLVEAYCLAFTKNDPVRLILKVHYKDYSMENFRYCLSKINGVLSRFPDHAQILLIASNLAEKDVLALHSIGDCYISLTRSEAFGLTIFDAFNYGKQVIATGYSGHLDYLGKNHPGLVEYTIEDVANMENFSHGYYMQGKQQWAKPNIEHAAALMKQTANI